MGNSHIFFIHKLKSKKWHGKKQSKITLKVGDYYKVFDFSDIAYLEANGSYTRVVMVSKKEKSLMVTLNLKALSSYLDDSFLKIHRSYVINPDYVSRICGNRVEMCTGELLDVSLPYKKLLWDTLNVVTLGKRYKEKRASSKES